MRFAKWIIGVLGLSKTNFTALAFKAGVQSLFVLLLLLRAAILPPLGSRPFTTRRICGTAVMNPGHKH